MATISVLLVDDEEEFLAFLKARLEGRGLNMFSAVNGLEALKTMDEHRIDVVVLDVRMPGMGGLEILRKTKQKHPLVEVILLSGHATVESAVEGLKLGAFDYVTKPSDISELVEKIKAAYARKETTEEKIRKARLDRIVRHPLAVFDEEE
ncbi:MAG: response regulator [Pirellulaceae bacterium]|nr:response regulator [Pirellulaceae bacterium]